MHCTCKSIHAMKFCTRHIMRFQCLHWCRGPTLLAKEDVCLSNRKLPEWHHIECGGWFGIVDMQSSETKTCSFYSQFTCCKDMHEGKFILGGLGLGCKYLQNHTNTKPFDVNFRGLVWISIFHWFELFKNYIWQVPSFPFIKKKHYSGKIHMQR